MELKNKACKVTYEKEVATIIGEGFKVVLKISTKQLRNLYFKGQSSGIATVETTE